MIYIRTKDGRIIDATSHSRIRTKVLKSHNTQWILKHIADTIEELIDGLIVENKYNKPIWFDMSVDEFFKMSIEDKQYMSKDWNYYAYIKTDKGLIYVAKMNEKGELELL